MHFSFRENKLSAPLNICIHQGYALRLQPPPQALRFSHGRGERETRVTGDEPQGTMGRVQTAPSRLPLRAHRRETSGYEAAQAPFCQLQVLICLLYLVSLALFGLVTGFTYQSRLQSLKNCPGMSLVRVLLHRDLINCSSIAFKQFWPEKNMQSLIGLPLRLLLQKS